MEIFFSLEHYITLLRYLKTRRTSITIVDLWIWIKISEEGQSRSIYWVIWGTASYWNALKLIKWVGQVKGSLMNSVNLGNSKKEERKESIIEALREHESLEKNSKDPSFSHDSTSAGWLCSLSFVRWCKPLLLMILGHAYSSAWIGEFSITFNRRAW